MEPGQPDREGVTLPLASIPLIGAGEAVEGPRDLLTRGQRAVHDAIRLVAPDAVLGGSAAMAEQGQLGAADGLRRLGGLDFYLSATRNDNRWSIDHPWPVMRFDWPGPGPDDLPALPQIQDALREAGLQVVSTGDSRRLAGQRSEGVRLEVQAGDERVRVDVRPVRRELSEQERRTGMLSRDELAKDKIHAALDPERSSATQVLDAATMLAEMGEAEFGRTVRSSTPTTAGSSTSAGWQGT